MKQYPSISGKILNVPVYAFDKLDGSNMRAEWNRLLDDSNPILKKSIPLFQAKYTDSLSSIFKKNGWERAVVFFEFYGPNSFAGQHEENDEHTVTVFDIDVFKRGLLSPREFRDLLFSIETAKLLYCGNANSDFVESVRSSSLPEMSFEGVVCKTQDGKSFKIKSQAWLDKLKTRCKGDEELFNKLS